MKNCNKCNKNKYISEFGIRKSTKDGFNNSCKLCLKKTNQQYYKENFNKIKKQKQKWNKENVTKIKIQKQKWYSLNKEILDIKLEDYRVKYRKDNKENKIWYDKEYNNNNKEKIKERNRKYRENNKHDIRIKKMTYKKHRRLVDPVYRLRENISSIVRQSFKRNGYTKDTRTHIILGCTFEVFKEHIESNWKPWMNWDNYGKYNGDLNYGWDIDHIIPLSSAINEVDVVKLNHHTNLQPLCSKVNRDIKKGFNLSS